MSAHRFLNLSPPFLLSSTETHIITDNGDAPRLTSNRTLASLDSIIGLFSGQHVGHPWAAAELQRHPRGRRR